MSRVGRFRREMRKESCASEGFAKTLETNEMSGWSHTRKEECLESACIPASKNYRGEGGVNWVHV